MVTVFPFETVRFIAQFSTHESDTVPYMYHCHMLVHEDQGMMGQFIVTTDSTLSVKNHKRKLTELTIYPNPVNDVLNIDFNGEINSIGVYNLSGELVIWQKTPETSINVGSLVAGFYIVEVLSDEGIQQRKFIKN